MTGGASESASEDELDASFEEVLSAVRSADRPLALRRAVDALARGLDDPLVLMLAAEAASDDGDLVKAHGYLDQATKEAPDDAEPWRRLGDTLAALGKPGAARDSLGKALALRPGDGATLLSLAGLDFQRGDLSSAERGFEAAALALPLSAAPLEGLAAIAARRRDAPRARTLAERALAASDATASAHFTLSRADLLDGEPEAAEARVSPFLDPPDPRLHVRITAHELRADARDAAGDPDGAFADYAARSQLIEQTTSGAPWRTGERMVDRALRITRFLSTSSPELWRKPNSGQDWEGSLKTKAHVFLVGFPRSGTTLLEKTLASHPAVMTLEEVDHLGAASRDLIVDDRGLARLMEITPEEANHRRSLYWQGVRATLGAGFVGRVIVDKLPLHTLALPAIAKLFPDAHILFALRDPRDVVFSCFRRRFVMNEAMAEFLRLDHAAAFYDAVMALARRSRDAAPLNAMDVRMEDVIADFDGEVARVLKFIGLKWDERVRGFAGGSLDRARTPSDLQLLRGLDDAGVGQWRRYANHLEPIKQTLAPWVEAYGYDA